MRGFGMVMRMIERGRPEFNASPSLRAQAKQSIVQQGSEHGLLRRFASRNDGGTQLRDLAAR